MDGRLELHPRDVRFQFTADPAEYWCRGDAFSTRFFDAFSTILPIAEQFFVEAVRSCERDIADPALAEQVRRFVLQEAAHGREHRRYNKRLRALGHDLDAMDRSQRRVLDRLLTLKRKTIPLAVVVAAEHLTAILCAALLRGELIAGATPEMLELWRWHSVEEVEHKAVAHDVYVAFGGTANLRRAMMVYIVLVLSIRMGARMADMLRRDGRLYTVSTWRSGARFLLGPKGFFEVIGRDFFAFFRADFHPWQIDDSGLVRGWERVAQAALDTNGVAS
jgi:predicted metal-dependent hydrolase